MTLLSIICVLVIEQFKALPAARIQALRVAYAEFLERQFNGGDQRHGMTAWMVGVALPALLVLGLSIGLNYLHPVLGFLLDVAVLYLVMGFRQFSHFFTDIQMALRMGEIERARQLLAEWRGQGAERLGSAEIARLAIEQGIVSSHRHVFAPLFWFIVLGPAGAVLYRLSFDVTQYWPAKAEPLLEDDHFGKFARQAFQMFDWLPARLTAVTFAVVGDFEDAVYCWRTQASQWAQSYDSASGILLSSGAGALGVRLGLPLPEVVGVEARPELGMGEDADVEHLQSAIGLVWRALVLCLLLLALLSMASWVGT
jgi:adenosylcobinamide-phosphate synthase